MHIRKTTQTEHVPLGSRHVPTVAEAIAELRQALDLEPQKRRNLIAVLRTIPRVYGEPAETIRLDPAELGRRYFGCSAAMLGISEASVSPYRNRLRAVLRRYGLIDRPRQGGGPLPSEWQALYAAVPDKFTSIRLRGFIGWCGDKGINPSSVSADILERYLAYQRHRKGVHAPTIVVRKVTEAWNRWRGSVPGWPDLILTAPDCSRQYSLPLGAYPSSLEAEVKAWEASRSEKTASSLFDGGVHRPLRKSTIEHRVKYIRLAAAALVATGTPANTISSLQTLITPASIERILEWHWERAGRTVTRNTGGLATTLVMVAEHVGVKDAALEEVRRLAKYGRPKRQSRMTPKNERRLAQLDNEAFMAKTLHLGKHLMRLAKSLKKAGDEYQAAWVAATAVAVEILLRCPLRIETLHALRLSAELVMLDGRAGRYTHLMVPGTRMKNGEPLLWRLHQETVEAIAWYLRNYRPALPGTSGAFLFPHRDTVDRPRSPGGLSRAIRVAFADHVGIEFNAHLFRGLACKITIDQNPEAIHDLRLLLGHKSLDTALQFYASFAPQKAADRLDARVTEKQRQSAGIARAAFGRLRPPKPKGSTTVARESGNIGPSAKQFGPAAKEEENP